MNFWWIEPFRYPSLSPIDWLYLHSCLTASLRPEVAVAALSGAVTVPLAFSFTVPYSRRHWTSDWICYCKSAAHPRPAACSHHRQCRCAGHSCYFARHFHRDRWSRPSTTMAYSAGCCYLLLRHCFSFVSSSGSVCGMPNSLLGYSTAIESAAAWELR